MKKTITRGQAIILYNQMATMAFGHLAEDMLESAMANFLELGKVVEPYTKMVEELGKRLFDGIDEQTIRDYNALSQKAERDAVKAAFPELYELVQKQNKVDAALRAKEIEVELVEVDKKEFVKGILKAKPTIANIVFDLFEPMFKEEKKAETTDFSELDDLMK